MAFQLVFFYVAGKICRLDETVYVVKKRKCLLKDDDDLRRRLRLDDKLSVRRKCNTLEAFCERYRYNRYPFEVDMDTSSSISSNLRSISKSSSSSFGSYSHSINYAGDKLNMVSFKKQFAASCLPSSVWNRSLPNISFSMMSSTSLLLSPSSSSYHTNEFFMDEYSLPHCSSVEYFTPERNYTPKCGAYCKWLPGDDLSEGKCPFVGHCSASAFLSLGWINRWSFWIFNFFPS